MKSGRHLRLSLTAVALGAAFSAAAELPLNYEAAFTAGTGSGDFAPFYISSLRHGRFTQADNVQAEARLWVEPDYSRRFSFGFGAGLRFSESSNFTVRSSTAAFSCWRV